MCLDWVIIYDNKQCISELIDDLEDDELSDIVFESDEESNEKPKQIRKSLKQKKGDIGSLFASAEEFASILEDEGTSGVVSGSSNAVSNKDNSSKSTELIFAL